MSLLLLLHHVRDSMLMSKGVAITFSSQVIDGVRPEILKSCPTELRTLMEECWREPENRPSFRQLIRVLTDFGRSLRRATVV